VTRTPAPPLAAPIPKCSVCGELTAFEGDEIVCYSCGISWPEDGFDEVEGSWDEPAAEQCPETVQPHLDNTWIKDDDPRKARTYRCILTAGHANGHADPELNAFARGWRG
jgi:hypothetical protein